jgi:CheY-like chemotaxis protein
VAARVLIIEDEALIALHLEQLVLDAGHKVAGIAMDPEEARAIARARKPDFALVDMRLRRGTSGLDAARYLREEGIPSIFISGNLDAGAKAAAAELRPLGFVGKPFFPVDIYAALEIAALKTVGPKPQSTAPTT